jgi:hypothetical protein
MLGGGYLLMPEPRLIHMGGQIVFGYGSGRSDAFSEYGHMPWQKGYKDEEREKRESASLYRFKAEYAVMKGAQYQANDFEFGGRSIPHDTQEDMERYRELLKRYPRR